MYFIDVPAVIDFFTDARVLAEGLKKMGAENVTAGAIEKWKERGQIPTKGLLLLKAYAHHRRREFNIDSFIRRA